MQIMPQTTMNHSLKFKFLLTLIILATLTRIAIPPFIAHPPNFSPIDAIALFCGAYFGRRAMAFIAVFFSVWLGDIVLNKILLGHWTLFYSGWYWQYGCYFVITLLGTTLQDKIKPIRFVATTVVAASLFFIISNFGVWSSGLLYPFTLEGLLACYVAAIPFFKATAMSDLFFSLVLFGSFELLQIKFIARKPAFSHDPSTKMGLITSDKR